jgi:hypothetical protein
MLIGFVAGGSTAEAVTPKPVEMVVHVLDQFGVPQVPASAVACPVVGGQQDCSNLIAAEVNRGGVAKLSLDPASVYRVFAVVADPTPAWACRGFVLGGQELYLSDAIEGSASQLPRAATLIVAEPSPIDCAVVTVVDDAGNALPNAGLIVCAHVPGSTDCVGDEFEGPDGDGVIRMKIDPALVYRLGAIVANTGWPCPSFISPTGVPFHFGESGSFTADDFIAGITLVIPQPSPDDCA